MAKELISHDIDKALLSFISPRQLIETNFASISPEATYEKKPLL
jgi:hypothetical protein